MINSHVVNSYLNADDVDSDDIVADVVQDSDAIRYDNWNFAFVDFVIAVENANFDDNVMTVAKFHAYKHDDY